MMRQMLNNPALLRTKKRQLPRLLDPKEGRLMKNADFVSYIPET